MPIMTSRDEASLQQARRMLQQRGALPEGVLPDTLGYVSRSWNRSAAAGLHAGLDPQRGLPVSRFELAQATERQHELLAHARPVMEYLHGQMRDSSSMVILADEAGLLLHALGDARFLDRAQRVALMPGASWHETHRGTNAIGTALAEGVPIAVHGAEHFLECNGFLTCAAAPVTGPDGRILGVLDISGERSNRHPHTFSMVRAATQMIENRLFEARHGSHVRLHFHPLPEGIGTIAEGVIALDETHHIVGANQAALAFLGLDTHKLGRVSLEQVFDTTTEQMLARERRQPQVVFALHLRGRQPAVQILHARVMLPAQGGLRGEVVIDQSVPSSAPQDELARLDTGDADWHVLIGKARKMLGQPIPLLLHGESGTGKEVLVKALHRSGPRSAQTLVAVNCAALPEHLIEAELFGYAPGAYTGARREGAPGRIREAHRGTLFLDEIGDMPLSLQTRLLRVLQDRQVVPLGGGQPIAVDFALICATHRDLKQEVAAGRFRADLYWRLNGLTLHLPPLRVRKDLSTLMARMLADMAPRRDIALAPELQQAFEAYGWPGNLRQLDNVLRTAVALLGDASCIEREHLPDDLLPELDAARFPEEREGSPSASLHAAECPEVLDDAAVSGLASSPVEPITLAALTLAAVEQALQAADGNVSLAARRLGVSRNTLYRRLRQRDDAEQPPA